MTDAEIDALATDWGMFSDYYENAPQEHCRRFARAVLGGTVVENRDAARYRWLRDGGHITARRSIGYGVSLPMHTVTDGDKAELDAHIDAALNRA